MSVDAFDGVRVFQVKGATRQEQQQRHSDKLEITPASLVFASVLKAQTSARRRENSKMAP
jgi:hypothetical protein